MENCRGIRPAESILSRLVLTQIINCFLATKKRKGKRRKSQPRSMITQPRKSFSFSFTHSLNEYQNTFGRSSINFHTIMLELLSLHIVLTLNAPISKTMIWINAFLLPRQPFSKEKRNAWESIFRWFYRHSLPVSSLKRSVNILNVHEYLWWERKSLLLDVYERK